MRRHTGHGNHASHAAGTKINVDTLSNLGLGTLPASSATAIAGLHDVTAAAGGLTLTDTKITGKKFQVVGIVALGWRSRRVVSQVIGESVVIGVIGGIAGVGLGFLGAGLVSRLAPALSASIGPTTGSATPGGARTFGGPGGGFRRPAAARGHCPRPGEEAQGPARRRADRQPR